MRIFLLRHGQTVPNLTGSIDTKAPGATLTALGFRQAQAVPVAFSAEIIDALFASTLLRTQLTVEPLAQGIGQRPEILDGLREILGGEFEGHSDKVSQGGYLDRAFAWAHGDFDRRVPGGEDGREFFSRYDTALSDILATNLKTVVVVSHGSAIRTWVSARANNVDGSFAGANHLDNTGCAVLEGSSLSDLTLAEWRSGPAGGPDFTDNTAIDPAGEFLES